jgi:hypothetical protein
MVDGGANQRIDRAGCADHTDDTANDEHEEDDVLRGRKALRDRGQKRQGREGISVNRMVAPRHDLPTIAVKLPRREQIRYELCRNNQREQQDQRIWETA